MSELGEICQGELHRGSRTSLGEDCFAGSEVRKEKPSKPLKSHTEPQDWELTFGFNLLSQYALTLPFEMVVCILC